MKDLKSGYKLLLKTNYILYGVVQYFGIIIMSNS